MPPTRTGKASIEVGRRLASARLRRGLSQATVARRAKLAPSYLSRIETGRVQPTFRTVQRVARALKAPFDEIAGPETSHSPAACPVTTGGACLLDLIHADTEPGSAEESFTPRQVQLLRRFAAWLRKVPADRQRAMEILLEEMTTSR